MYEFHTTTWGAAAIAGEQQCEFRRPVWDTKRTQKKKQSFNFARRFSKGVTLFVGEGNFSFSLSFARRNQLLRHKFVSTCFEKEAELSDLAYKNAQKLIGLGCRVQTSVDATKLKEVVRGYRFSTIVFQFPNVASRDTQYGQNPNHLLATRFLKSAVEILKPSGLVIISTVDSPFYEGAFKMISAAEKAGFYPPDIFDFKPNSIPNYTHQNTGDEETALDNHDAFATWSFSK